MTAQVVPKYVLSELKDKMAGRVFPQWFAKLLEVKFRQCYLTGGRASGKTKQIARYIIYRMENDWMPGNRDRNGNKLPCNVLCTREYQKNVDESVYDELVEAIYDLEYNDPTNPKQDKFKINKNEIIHLETGAKILFMGLWDSIRKSSGKGKNNIRLTWVEEADVCSEESFVQLTPTVMREDGCQIIYSTNVTHENDAVYIRAQHFKADPETIVDHVTFEHNIHVTDALLKTIVEDKHLNPALYEHVWLGKVQTNNDFIIFKKDTHWEYGNLDNIVKERELSPVYGCDGGNTERSPAVVVQLYRIDDNTFYVANTRHAYNLADRFLPALLCGNPRYGFDNWQNPQNLDGLIQPSLREFATIYFDCANVNAISELRSHNLNVIGAKKPQGSVLKGIQFIQGHKLIVNNDRINPKDLNSPKRCELLLTELMHYKYAKLPQTEKPDFEKPEKKDGMDHAIDALRYACQPWIVWDSKRRPTGMVISDRFRRRIRKSIFRKTK